MELWRPDPTFYPSPRMAMKAPSEKLAFVAMLNAENNGRPDALGVVDVDPASTTYGALVGRATCPTPATNCTTLVGTLAAHASAHTCRIRIRSGAT